MTKTNRRKFMSGIVSISLGVLTAKESIKTDALDLRVNSYSPEEDTYLEDIKAVTISIEKIELTSRNIDDRKDAEFSVYRNIGGNDIGKLMTQSVDVEIDSSMSYGPYQIDVRDGEKFKDRYLKSDEYTDQSNIELKFEFELSHPSLDETVTEQSKIVLGTAAGQLVSNTFKKESTKETKTVGDKYISIEASDLLVWNTSDRFTKLKTVMKGGQPTNNSSFSLPKGVIDVNKSEFSVSPRGYPEISLSEPDNSKYDINQT